MSTITIGGRSVSIRSRFNWVEVDYESYASRAEAFAAAFAPGGYANAVYIGSTPGVLKDKKALVRPSTAGFVLAQFDDMSTGYGTGWHRFPQEDFTLVILPPLQPK